MAKSPAWQRAEGKNPKGGKAQFTSETFSRSPTHARLATRRLGLWGCKALGAGGVQGKLAIQAADGLPVLDGRASGARHLNDACAEVVHCNNFLDMSFIQTTIKPFILLVIISGGILCIIGDFSGSV